MTEHFVITIARQYGSGGREIGHKIGELLGIKVFDRELITIAAQKSGLHMDVLHKADEKATSSLLYTLAMGSASVGTAHFNMDIPINDKLFITQSDIIKSLVEEQSCVIVGRCSDYVLRNYPNRLSVFIHADPAARIKHIAAQNQVSESAAQDMMKKTDKRRVNYYNFYTGRKWGAFENYHASFNSGMLGIDGTARIIADMAMQMMKERGIGG